MPYFRQFPKVDYDFNRTGAVTQMLDIFRSVRPLPDLVDNFSGYRFYEIKNGERPDLVSQRLYGTPDFYWTFFIVNEFLHDGYRAWPMSQEDLHAYMEKEYDGKVLEIQTTSTTDIDGNIETINSIAGKFTIGEDIVGQTSSARGKLIKKNIDMNQLIVRGGTSQAFIGDGTSNFIEEIVGQSSTDRVNTHKVYNYADAPYYYYDENDGEKKPVTNALHITGGVATSDLAYQSYRNFEFERNEERSKIRYVDPNYIEQFVNQFEEILNV